MARLKEQYVNEIAPALNKKFGYKSVMQIPKLDKVIINVAAGEAKENAKVIDAIVKDLGQITGQKAVVCTAAKREYDRIAPALERVRNVGYGIVMPEREELTLEEPELVRQGGRFGVRLRASAPSIHLIRADIETEVSPAVGSERQSEELVQYLMKEFEGDAGRIWQSNIFGKSLHELVTEGLNAKLNHMPDEARNKLRETIQRIINEGSGGLICIIL